MQFWSQNNISATNEVQRGEGDNNKSEHKPKENPRPTGRPDAPVDEIPTLKLFESCRRLIRETADLQTLPP
jgi:hypothetical protein